MSPNEAIRYFEDDSFSGDRGVTTTAKKGEFAGSSYANFWREYKSTVDRKTESEIDRKIEREIEPLLNEFTRYSIGWDSYNAPPLQHDTAGFALSVLNSIMRTATPLPQVGPSSVGGVQLEWHEKGVDLELHITAPYECDVWFRDNYDPDSQPISAKLTNGDFSSLKTPIDLLTNR
jgi:hypothetical protein